MGVIVSLTHEFHLPRCSRTCSTCLLISAAVTRSPSACHGAKSASMLPYSSRCAPHPPSSSSATASSTPVSAGAVPSSCSSDAAPAVAACTAASSRRCAAALHSVGDGGGDNMEVDSGGGSCCPASPTNLCRSVECDGAEAAAGGSRTASSFPMTLTTASE
eukprot:scaffold23058_cov68-Phaeocystis_antarctica.AAC.9